MTDHTVGAAIGRPPKATRRGIGETIYMFVNENGVVILRENGIDFENGVITIDEVMLGPGYSFNDFMFTRLFNHQNENRFFWFEEHKTIGDNTFAVGLAFQDRMLILAELMCVDEEFSWETEEKRKELHDRILRKYGIDEEKQFWWGTVCSDFDHKSGISSIVLSYSSVLR